MIAPASKVIVRVPNFVGISSQEDVVVSSDVRAKCAEKGLQFAWDSTEVSWVRDRKLVF
jgi:hypothetical protein